MIFNRVLQLALLPLVAARVQFLGVAISGGDFGCEIDGSCPTGRVQLPLSSLGGGDGEGQMNHFVKDSKMNMFRIPVSWQFLVNNNPAGPIDARNLARYDQVLQVCLRTGAFCMIDIHNFARYNGGIIGQGGPPDEQFVSLWSQLATKYAANPKVVFELMNEPHDLDINIWAATCQKVVNAIRQAGARSQMILLPGTNFDSAEHLVGSGSAEALMAITNPDGSTTGLLLDVHKYLDVDNSGTHRECVTDNIESFRTVAEFLRAKGRQGLVSESGASSDASCFRTFCAQNVFINQNSDVFVGFVGWAAGSFNTGYILSLTPSRQGPGYVDNELMKQCVIAPWVNTEQAAAPPPPGLATTTPTSTKKTAPTPPSASTSLATTTVSSGATPILGTGPRSSTGSGAAAPTGASPGLGTNSTGSPAAPTRPLPTGSACRMQVLGRLAAVCVFVAVFL